MSSQTPNLNLVLPVGTENVSRQIINDNNTKIDTAVGSNSQAITNLSGKIDVESVTSLPFRTGIFYCSTAQTIGSVTIPNHFMYDIHVSGTTATGIAVQATTGVAYLLYGYDGAWVSAVELAPMGTVVETNLSFTIATANAWQMVGFFAIPPKSEYVLNFWARYVNAEPQMIRITNTDNAYTPFQVLSGNENGSGTSLCGYNNSTSNKNVYVWVKYNGGQGTQNRVDISGITRVL